MAESSCSKSSAQKNPVLSFYLHEDSDDDVEIIPDIIGEDECIDLFSSDDAFEDFEGFEEELEPPHRNSIFFLDFQTYSTKFFK